MFLKPFHSSHRNTVIISAEQGSSFAKSVSNDFNPIHDVDSKRFCVPGDLLFALVLQRYGLSQEMSFNFSGMVSADTELLFPEAPGESFEILDSRGKCYLQVIRSGESTHDLAGDRTASAQLCVFLWAELPLYFAATNGRAQCHDQPPASAGYLSCYVTAL